MNCFEHAPPRRRVVLLSCLIAAVLLTSVAHGAQTRYVGPAWSVNAYQELCTCGYNVRAWNKVYRPLYNYYGLAYSGYEYHYNNIENPYTDPRDASYAIAYCYNPEGFAQNPVDCITGNNL